MENGEMIEVKADALEESFDAFEQQGGLREDAVAALGAELALLKKKIADGTIAAQRITISGMRGGKPALRFRANWYCSADIDEDWGLRESGWRVRVEGDTPLDVSITFPVAPENYAAFTPGLTAHRAVNAVPVVCEAPPGIRTTVDLPHIIATF